MAGVVKETKQAAVAIHHDIGTVQAPLTVEEKFELITRNTVDDANTLLTVDVAHELKAILAVRDLKLYWGTATTGTPHIAYFLPMSKIADFLRAGCEVTVLLADLHAYLDNQKAPEELLAHRVEYYREIIIAILETFGVSIEKLKFVKGTTFQKTDAYTWDVYRLCANITERKAKKAGAEVVKQVDNAPLAGLLYPLLQALDEEYLHVDAQFGGVDQRKIFVLAEEVLPKHLKYKKRIHIMNPMVPGFDGGKGNKAAGETKSAKVEKMSSSSVNAKIDLLDTPEVVNRKIGSAYASAGEVKGNGLLVFIRMVLFTVNKEFVVEREAKFGGSAVYKTYAEVERAYLNQTLFPQDLKNGVAAAINRLLAPIIAKFASRPDLQELLRLAYPERLSAVKMPVLSDEARLKKKKVVKGGDPAKRAEFEAKRTTPKQNQKQQQHHGS